MARFELAGMRLTDAQGLAFSQDFDLIALSYFIAVFGSYAALELAERCRAIGGDKARYWRLANAVTLGGSIWSMHFIAMLSLKIGLPISHATGPIAVSLILAIAAVSVGLKIARIKVTWMRIGLAGPVVGCGLMAMHYVGMAGLRFPGSLAYTPALWSLSVLTGVTLATVALWLSPNLPHRWQRTVAAPVIALAICGTHRIAMASTVFQADPLNQIAPDGPAGSLVAAIALPTLALILSAQIFVASDRRLRASALREADARRHSSQLAQANAELEVSRQQLRAILSNIPQGVSFFDGAERLVVCNQRYADLYHLPPEVTRPGCPFRTIVAAIYAGGNAPDVGAGSLIAWRNQIITAAEPASKIITLTDGRSILVHRQILPDSGWVATHEDITERQRAEAEIVFMANHDALTQLPNRLLLQERLEQAIAMAKRGTPSAILCLDLDHFKMVNDTLGHPVGDALLQAVAARLKGCIREVDTLARLGGDEFAIIQLGPKRAEDAEALARRIIAAVLEPFEIDGHQIVIGTSVGVAIAGDEKTSSEKLLKDADIALYLAKSEGRNSVRFYEPEMDAHMQLRRLLELELRGAVAREEFEVYYQPLINLAAGRISGFEALVRWNHPQRGVVSPDAFIPVAEETGMIMEIGEWVLRTACKQAANWPAEVSVAVNLSPVQFRRGDLLGSITEALDASGLRAGRLELEITESVLLQNTPGNLAVLHQVRALGVAVSLDDFGTGYSSLSYLRRFPFDKIKIDQSFVRDMVKDEEDMSIIRAIINLGQNLNMRTTAEGVETLEQLEKLRAEGCTEAQGYYFSRPKRAGDLPALFERFQSACETAE